jgi:hypothetical protein
MKKVIASGAALVGVFLGGFAVRAATSPTPEIDRANATIQLAGQLKGATCVGEDQIDYITYKGSWKGGETQIVPDPTDYNLTGSLTVTKIQWTINQSTGRGVLTGTIALTVSTSTGQVPEYSGKLTLITQSVAGTTTASARGWIVANFLVPDDGVPPPNDDSLVANVEFKVSTTSATGQFGDLAGSGSLGFPDYSVVTNVAPKAADGVC